MSPAEYLKKPYGRLVVPDSDGTYSAEIIEFPGCIAVGDTAAEALANLEEVAASWLEATLARGQRVPQPIENEEFSGKTSVRLGKSLHKKAAHQAARNGTSLNQFIVSCVAEGVGSQSSAPSSRQIQYVMAPRPMRYVATEGVVDRFGASEQRASGTSDTEVITIPF